MKHKLKKIITNLINMDSSFIVKYSPKTISDIKSDENFKKMLHTLLNIDILTVIFIGDSGSGKTTIINLLIEKYYGDEDYKDEVLYINNLKDQGINYYRTNVKNFCQTKSSIPNKKKFVVLDDLDMINEQSQQVFRICIDQYKDNVHFICSCKNIQKIIDTMQSRMFTIKIKNPKDSMLREIMNNIVKNEKINIEKEAMDYLLLLSQGSIRSLVNNLEKINLLDDKVTTKKTIDEIITNIKFSDFEKFTKESIKNGNLKTSIDILMNIFEQGYSVIDILETFFSFVKITNLLDENEKYRIIKIICKYITIFYNIHEDEIELPLFVNSIINELH